MYRAFFIAAILLFSTGCIGIQDPEVRVVGVRMDEVSSGGARVLVDLMVTNPNDEELPMPEVSYRVDVVGGGAFEFTDRPYAAAPRNGQMTLTLAAAVRGIGIEGRRVLVEGEMVFEPQGELRRVFYDNNYPLPRSSFSGEGVLE